MLDNEPTQILTRPRSPTAVAAKTPADVLPDCRIVTDRDELAVHLAIRHAVFVDEQAVFSYSDRDSHDQDPATLHVLAWEQATPVGAVRLYPAGQPGCWKGDRLAVLRVHRGHRSAEALVRFAVRTAAERGGHLMEAQVQPANVKFFSNLGWQPVGPPAPYLGMVHQAMVIKL